MIRLVSIALSIALTTGGCHDPGTERDEPTNTGGLDSTDPGRVLEPGDLVAAAWPEDLARVVTFETETGVVIDGLNHAGELIARVELAEVSGSPNVQAVRADFEDMSSWAMVDTMNGVLVQHSTEPTDDATIAEITARAQALSKKAHEQDSDPSEPMPGPWLDCALSVLNAVFVCLPVLGGGWLGGCPKAIVEAYCKCWSAKKKNKNKPKPAACEAE